MNVNGKAGMLDGVRVLDMTQFEAGHHALRPWRGLVQRLSK